ncbi:MAG TPA: hypothetical protein VHC43_16525 [Mycobacteriales bacterium]|nr:hypothetical protein [Mycobacteriales bacterium]
MTIPVADELVPLERLYLREALQDRWRQQVRRITLLSLAMYDDPDAAEPTAEGADAGSRTEVEADLSAARELLTEIEAAMLRLDDGSYGTCAACGGGVGSALLLADPLMTVCQGCRPLAVGAQSLLTRQLA